jgi:apolipoprotein N-acyltransferase
MATYAALSAPPAEPIGAGTVLVWPETAFPFALREDPEALAVIADLLPPGAALVTGAWRTEYGGSGERRIFNAVFSIGDDGAIRDGYDKVHLVPFGEYLPFGFLVERAGLRQLVQGAFSPGARRRSINLPSAPPFAPLICYEAIFPGAVLPEGPRPGFLLNVTNDGWFGRTIGPYQHFHQSRIRSVEEGLPLVRAANTGISGVIDAYGRIVARTRLGTAEMVEAPLPRAIDAPLYAQWRSLALILSVSASLLLAMSQFTTGRSRLY